MVSLKIQCVAVILLVSEVYTQLPYRYRNQQSGLPIPPGQFIIPAIFKPQPPKPPTPKPKQTKELDRQIHILICKLIEENVYGKEGTKTPNKKWIVRDPEVPE